MIITPKTNLEKTNKKLGLHGMIELIEVNEIAIWDILFGEKIKAKNFKSLRLVQEKTIAY